MDHNPQSYKWMAEEGVEIPPEEQADPGGKKQVKYSMLKLVTGTDLAIRRIPKMIVDSGKSGPTIWCTGCIHGDEIGGTVVIHDLFKVLRKLLIKGRVCSFPIVNPFGFEANSRFLPYSNEDLNRLFPGKPRGSMGQRITHTIFETIMRDRPDLVLDFHNDWIRSIPYTLLDRSFTTFLDRPLREKLSTYAKAIGFPVVMDAENLNGTLSGTLIKNNVPALTIEVGEALTVNELMTRKGVEAVLKLLAHMEMVTVPEDLDVTQGIPDNEVLLYEHHPLCSTSGIIRFKKGEGDHVKKGEVIAKVYNAFGKSQETLYALNDALVLGRTDHSLSFPGFPVMAFGTKKTE